MKVACIQINASENMGDNLFRLSRLLVQAKEKGAEIICLPENVFIMAKGFKHLWDNSYYMKDHVGIKECQKWAETLEVDIIIGSVAIKEKWRRRLKNRSIYINNKGEIIGYYDKIHLFDATLSDKERYRESRHFIRGSRMKIVDSQFGKVGLTICHDIRYSYLYRKLAQKGSDFITIPAAFAYTTGVKHWHVLLRARAIETGSFIFAPALCGQHNKKRRSYGHSLILDPDGKILAEASEDKDEVIIAKINKNRVQQVRASLGNLKRDKL